MRITFIISLIFLCTGLYGQVNYTANDLINPYNGGFKAGVNPGYYGSNWKSRDLADLAAGNPATDTEGVGVRAYRGSLPEGIARQYGYSIWTPTYEYYNAIGLKDNTVFVGFASDDHKDPVEYCPGVQSDMFANLYEDIWDNGENGTPINENNYYALYLYNVINAIGDNVRFWEIWNEPGFDYSGVHGWLPPGAEGNWWENNPDPCDYKLQAPVFHYIRTLRISYEVIKTLSPDDYVVVSGVGYNSFLDVILRNTDNPIDGSVTSEYPNKGGAYFDVLGFHAYPHFDGSVRYWDNDIDDFVYTRHSDAAIEGLEERQMERADILGQYGYDGNTYPEKLWTITEINVPRKEFDENFGGEELQVNYMIKMVTNAIQNEITQTHVFGLAEKQYIDDAEDPFDVMGLYQNLKEIGPWEQTVNQSGIAYKTASDLLYQSSFDDNQTDLMNLPDNIKGGAFQQSNGEYIYVIWARTETDNTEDASANYAFPGAMGINSLTKKEWDFSQTKTSSTISSNNITLTGTPIFISPSSNQNVGELTLNCPPRLIEMGVPGADGGAIISWEEPTVSSTCSLGGATVDLVSSIPNGSFFPIGVTVVEYLATDACGNEVPCALTVQIAVTDGGLGDCHPYRYTFNYRGQYNGNKYLLSTYDTTYQAAKEIAASHGGHLVSIGDADENEFVTDAIGSNVVYIGLNDEQTEGQLQWPDNTPVNYTNFDDCSWCASNDPDFDYVQLHPWNGEWSFNGGNLEYFFVMELPCGETTNCTDNDEDGVCADTDCDDNNPSLPNTPGTACNDNNSNTTDDMIQSDGCTCAGEAIGTCNIDISSNAGSITITGLTEMEYSKLFDSDNNIIWACKPWGSSVCSNLETISGLTVGATYYLQVKSDNCDEWIPITIEGGNCIDNDNDGICAEADCDDNDPNLPATAGTVCDDNNSNTTNDVIQSDGCTCAGEAVGGSCNIGISTNAGVLTITGLTAAEHTKLFDSDINPVWSCKPWGSNVCSSVETINGLTIGATYYLQIKSDNCDEWISVIIEGGNCVDNDEDGICADEDCNDNDPNFPQTPGTTCDDNDANTNNDVIQADGCTCAGVPINNDPCNVSYVASGSTLTVNGLTAPNHILKLFNSNWQIVFECTGNCETPTLSIPGLSPGEYHLKVKSYNEEWDEICSLKEDLMINPGIAMGVLSNTINQGTAPRNELINPGQTEIADALRLYPNPTNSQIYVELPGAISLPAQIVIYNDLGQVMSNVTSEEVNANLVQLDCSQLSDGLYLLMVRTSAGNVLSAKFAKQ